MYSKMQLMDIRETYMCFGVGNYSDERLEMAVGMSILMFWMVVGLVKNAVKLAECGGVGQRGEKIWLTLQR